MTQKEFKNLIELYKTTEAAKPGAKYTIADYDFLFSAQCFLSNLYFRFSFFKSDNFEKPNFLKELAFIEPNFFTALEKEIEENSIYIPLYRKLVEKGLDPINKRFYLTTIDTYLDNLGLVEDFDEIILEQAPLIDLINELKNYQTEYENGNDSIGLECDRFRIIAMNPNSYNTCFLNIQDKKVGSTLKLSTKEAFELYELNTIFDFKNTVEFKEQVMNCNVASYQKALHKAQKQVDLYQDLIEKEKQKILKLKGN